MNNKGFHVSVKPVTKGNGGSVIAKSAYNSGSKLEDKKTKKVHDYSSKMTDKNIKLIDKNGVETIKNIEKNVAHSVLIVPRIADKITVDREQFWNDIELIEKSAKAQLGVEIDVMFPKGLSADQRIELVESYSQELADRYNILVDVNIHKPHTHVQKKDDGQVLEITKDNHHAHILLSSREIIQNSDDSYSLSKRKNWGLWSTGERLKKGLNGRGDELKYQRKLWADLANDLLPDNLMITEKSYREQGINQLPKMKLGKSLYKDILKGKNSVVNEYNETIDELNKYIKANDIVIDYGDQGRIDNEINEQDFKGVTVAYKKRKPFANININNLSYSTPKKELDKAVDNVKLLADFMSLADNIELRNKTERSALLSTINAIDERLSKQAEQVIFLKDRYQKTPNAYAHLGQEFSADIDLVTSRIPSIKTIDEVKAIKEAVKLVEQFKQDEMIQTTQSVNELKKHLDQIDKQTLDNQRIIKELIPIHGEIINASKALRALEKPFNTTLDKVQKELDKINELVIEKKMNKDRWTAAFNRLVDIEVTDNMQTFDKFKALADYDVEALKELEHTYEQLKHIKAYQIDDKTQQQLDNLVQSISDYKDKTDSDLKALKLQINTSEKSYQRLEPLYTQRTDLLDQSAAVIEQDDDLHDEIITTKTTQLNNDRLNEWRERTHQLHAQLIRHNEQVEREQEAKRQAEAAAEKLAAQRRQDQEKEQQIKVYKDRINVFIDGVIEYVTDIDFNAINAPDALINSAQELAARAAILDGHKNTDRLTPIQRSESDNLTEKAEITAKNATKNFTDQLDTLPNNKQKVEVIEQLSAKFNQVLEWQTGNETIKEILPQLEQQQQTIQQSLDRANSYSAPRPF
ncbi:MobA/MobL family protein [Psychrobacter sp. M13]|uniref:MobA/MobL family protein n=1 Tax=Psychrobacter sp. M13 TaxID=3067275 RepID=UPI00273C7369|nr:MobA/MobL family protein [Psychrobacter sp. M13]WLP95932.1 MobA/MobL family protein [Psychrobacter sp. M13]